MAKIRINAAARAVIRASVRPGATFRETAIEVQPGVWEVEVDQITLETLEANRQQSGLLDYSDVILWLATRSSGRH